MRNRAGEETATRIVDAAAGSCPSPGSKRPRSKRSATGLSPAGQLLQPVRLEGDRHPRGGQTGHPRRRPDPDRHRRDHVTDLVEAFVRFVEDRPDLARVYITVGLSGGVTDAGIRSRMIRHHSERVARFTAALQRDRPALGDAEAEGRWTRCWLP
jgi:hypothetical protein